ncbi:hypothetical protein MLGJGCBP_07891 [Rhodococcus sp. T7]|nr:hypothetical protein MLGJGCBP_09006 [Rhodococcus sp. T7]KAF0959014.1 hypothetical protein MLGJGCBP_07891 [Rhodococcus sp. T7]
MGSPCSEYRTFEYRQSASSTPTPTPQRQGWVTAPAAGRTPPIPARLDEPRRYRHDWTLFADCCEACDHRALPTHPSVLVEFLADHPTAEGTQRRRVTAINAVHTGAGLPEPGRAETIRQLLSTARADRLARVGERVADVVPRIPVTGWPGGVFGRRDALILTLAAAGVSFEQIARLRRTDIITEDDALMVRVAETWLRIPTEEVNSVDVHSNWIEVLGFLDRYPSTRLLAARLDANADLTAFTDHARCDDRPLLTIDRWGHTPFAPTPLTGHAVAAIVRAHLTGQPPVHRGPPSRRPPSSAEAQKTLYVAEIELEQEYYDRGVAPRRDAHTHLGDVTDLLDSVEDEADRLLADLLVILGNIDEE